MDYTRRRYKFRCMVRCPEEVNAVGPKFLLPRPPNIPSTHRNQPDLPVHHFDSKQGFPTPYQLPPYQGQN